MIPRARPLTNHNTISGPGMCSQTIECMPHIHTECAEKTPLALSLIAICFYYAYCTCERPDVCSSVPEWANSHFPESRVEQQNRALVLCDVHIYIWFCIWMCNLFDSTISSTTYPSYGQLWAPST